MEKWQDPETLALWFGIVILFVLILVISIIILVRINYKKIIKRQEDEAQIKIQHQRELLETNIVIQEKERDRIAADLHDSLIGKLTAIRLTNQINGSREDIDRMMNESITEARRITHDLSPPLIEHTPIDELIKDLSEPWMANFDLVYHIEMRAHFNLSPQTKIQLTRIVQEILTNITKHSGATSIQIHIRQTERLLAIYLQDNGKGLDVQKMKQGLGLRSIESRVQYIHAKYKIRSKINKGTSFIFLLPRENSTRKMLT